MKIRFYDESYNLVEPKFIRFIDIDFESEAPIIVIPNPPAETNEYEVITDSFNIGIYVHIGKIDIYRYRGIKKDLNVIIPYPVLSMLGWYYGISNS